jgi:hypothetical protein
MPAPINRVPVGPPVQDFDHIQRTRSPGPIDRVRIVPPTAQGGRVRIGPSVPIGRGTCRTNRVPIGPSIRIALCLFARKSYPEAAAGLYAVQAAGPGWDWKTMSALYPDTNTYTQQLRALEQFVKEHHKDAQGRFLLGYHYMVLNERDAAREQFTLAADQQPKDKLSAQLAEALAEKPPTPVGGMD